MRYKGDGPPSCSVTPPVSSPTHLAALLTLERDRGSVRYGPTLPREIVNSRISSIFNEVQMRRIKPLLHFFDFATRIRQ
jgi:hypothetical protein